MCGCNSNVKFAKEAVATTQYVVPPPKSKITNSSCDLDGKNCRLESIGFTTSEGASLAIASRNTGTFGSNFPKESFTISFSGNVTSIGLRQLAEKLAFAADNLDGQRTIVAIADGSVKVKTGKKRKTSRKGKK